MKRLLLTILIIANTILLHSQHFCALNERGYANRLQNREVTYIHYEGPFHVRVFFHIIQNNDGTGENSFSISDIPLCIQTLNNDFANFGILFEYIGADYIFSDRYYSTYRLTESEYNYLMGINVSDDAINIYLLPTDNVSARATANSIPGTALAIGGRVNDVIMGYSHALSHEMGHCLGLFHTFHGGIEETDGCPELVDGSNCAMCGDYVCDTPADPFDLKPYINSECLWVNTCVTDSNGQLYSPDTRQIMAYVDLHCMEHFSIGQGERMIEHMSSQRELLNRTIASIAYIQNGDVEYNNISGSEVVNALDSILVGRNVMSGTIGDVEVLPDALLWLTAGKKIILKQGFKVHEGGTLWAEIYQGQYPPHIGIRAHNIQTSYLPLLENTEWTSIFSSWDSPLKAKVSRIEGDTLIRDKTYKILKSSIIDIDHAEVYSMTETHYLREEIEHKHIYEYSPNHKEILLYDFSLQIDDTCPVHPDYTLREISSIENTGYVRKHFIFTNNLHDTIVWIEGIGNYTDMLIPIARKFPNERRILCVLRDSETIYDTGVFEGKMCADVKYIIENNVTNSIDSLESETPSARKILHNGQIFIERGGKIYTIQGVEEK